MLLTFSLLLKAQNKYMPINISLFNESTSVPFTHFFTVPIHPGLQLGTEFNYRNKKQSRIFQTANVSYFYHNHLAQGIGLTSELGYEKRLKNGFAFSFLLGTGYLHTFTTSEEFIFKNGQYVKNTDKGNSRLYPSLSFETGCYLKFSSKASSKIFMRYQSWVEYPYSPDFIPVMAHINLHIGTKIFIIKKAKKND